MHSQPHAKTKKNRENEADEFKIAFIDFDLPGLRLVGCLLREKPQHLIILARWLLNLNGIIATDVLV